MRLTFGPTIKERKRASEICILMRSERRLTQKELAGGIGCARAYISWIESQSEKAPTWLVEWFLNKVKDRQTIADQSVRV